MEILVMKNNLNINLFTPSGPIMFTNKKIPIGTQEYQFEHKGI